MLLLLLLVLLVLLVLCLLLFPRLRRLSMVRSSEMRRRAGPELTRCGRVEEELRRGSLSTSSSLSSSSSSTNRCRWIGPVLVDPVRGEAAGVLFSFFFFFLFFLFRPRSSPAESSLESAVSLSSLWLSCVLTST